MLFPGTYDRSRTDSLVAVVVAGLRRRNRRTPRIVAPLMLVVFGLTFWWSLGRVRGYTGVHSFIHGKNLSVRDGTQVPLGPVDEVDFIRQWRKGAEAHDADALQLGEVAAYVSNIMSGGSYGGGVDDEAFWRPKCLSSIAPRYDALKNGTEDGKTQYFFALDLYQAASVMPSLLGAIVQTIRFLGPDRCTVSIVEGRSTDGTYQIAAALKDEIYRLGATFHLSTSSISPQDGKQDRMAGLAFLRNLALAPLIAEPEQYSPETQIIFLNDIHLCPHDILELLLQQRIQNATMTCGMDWSEQGSIFYDIYVARSIVGETFWQIAQDGLWKFSGNLFWADHETKTKFLKKQPFKVYACWNGGAVIAARPIMQRQIQFRRNDEEGGECYMGEATLFAKDLWRLGMGRVQVVPSVNVAYGNETDLVKDLRGRVEDNLDMESGELQTELVEWQESPPSLVKCMRQFHDPYWVPST